MKGKKTATILIAAGAAAGVWISRVIQKRRAKSKTHRAEATVARQEGRFEDAVHHLSQIHSLSQEDSKHMAEAYIKLGRRFEGLIFMDKCIQEMPSKELLSERISLYTSLGFDLLILKDLLLISLLEGRSHCKDDSGITNALKALSSLYALNARPVGKISKIALGNFFDTFLFLDTISDPVVVFIRSDEYDKCWELVKDPETDIHRLVKAGIEYVNGFIRDAIETLSTMHSDIAKAFLFFIQAEKRKHERDTCMRCSQSKYFSHLISDPNLDPPSEPLIDDSEDPTVNFYLAKGYDFIGITDKSKEHLEKSLASYPSYPALSYKIITLFRSGEPKEALKLIFETEKKYPGKLEVHCMAAEYFVHNRMENEALEWLCNMERIDQNDTRTHLFKYIIGRALKKECIQHLQAAIAADPFYFRNYVYLANHLMEKQGDSYNACLKALEFAHGFDESFISYQLWLFVQAHCKAKSEFPRLFDNENHSS